MKFSSRLHYSLFFAFVVVAFPCACLSGETISEEAVRAFVEKWDIATKLNQKELKLSLLSSELYVSMASVDTNHEFQEIPSDVFVGFIMSREDGDDADYSRNIEKVGIIESCCRALVISTILAEREPGHGGGQYATTEMMELRKENGGLKIISFRAFVYD